VSTYLAPLDSIDDVEALESALGNLKSKEELATKEIKRLAGQLERASSSPSSIPPVLIVSDCRD